VRSTIADRYVVQRELGRGGMATVFLAADVKHRRPVALKVLHSELAAAIGAERFLREIEIAARLQHPHILPLYDSGAAQGFLYYVMPYVEGESLRERLTREKQLPFDETVRIASEVASALAYAHGHGIVHRDVKPENIMLAVGTAVVTDFGIARAITAAENRPLTQTGTILGTPAYMSPEQATGQTELDGSRRSRVPRRTRSSRGTRSIPSPHPRSSAPRSPRPRRTPFCARSRRSRPTASPRRRCSRMRWRGRRA